MIRIPTLVKCLASCLAFVVTAAALAQAENAVGAWKINIDMGGTPIPADLVVKDNGDGTLSGTLVGPPGEIVLEKITFEGNKLSFTQSVEMGGETPVEFKFNGTIEGDKVTGMLASEMMGEMAVTGTRGGAESNPVASGEIYALEIDSPLGLLEHKLIVSQDGTAAHYEQDGETAKLENFKMADNKMTFPLTIQTYAVTMELTKEGENITGDVMLDGESVATVTGKHAGTVTGGDAAMTPTKPEELAKMTALHGTWNLEVDSPLGLLEHKLIVNPDGTVQYDQGTEAAKLEGFISDGTKISFPISIQGYDVIFDGKLNQGNIEGNFNLDGSPVAPVVGEKAAQ